MLRNLLKITRVILAGIIILASFLRFFQLGSNPPSLTWDEVAWGYNAYSLGIDGRDEFGRFLPLNYIESFGDFKPPLYAYLVVLPVKLFGLTELATRIPSAFFGVLTVVVTFFLTKRIFQSSEYSRLYGFLTAFLLAISPWHVNLSRAAFEANVASFFIITGVWLFLIAVQEKKWYLLFSIASFAFSMYTFNTARVVSPLLLGVLAIGFRKQLFQMKRETVITIFLGIIIMAPSLRFFLSPQASLRFREVNIFSSIGIIYKSNDQVTNDNNASWSKILHNRRFLYAVEYLRHYFDHFHPNFLFIRGDGNPKFSTQDLGQLYLWELPFFIAGILLLFRKRTGNWWLVPVWLLIGIIPAASARETPHALRIETSLPTFQILTAFGVATLLTTMQKVKFKSAIYSILFLLVLFNFLYYARGYYVHYPREYSGEWQYGYKESIAFVKDVEKDFDKIYMTTELGRPYIYYLFYLGVDPRKFRSDADIKREVYGFVHVDRFGKYYFAKELKRKEGESNKILYIDVNGKLPNNAKVLRTFNLLNGSPVLVAYTFE